MVLVVVRDRAREMGVPKRGWRTQPGCSPSLPKIRCHLQRKHTERRLLPLEAHPEAGLRERGSSNAQNNQKQLPRRVGRQKNGTYVTYITQHTRSNANSLFLIIVHASVTGSSSSRSSVRVCAIILAIVTVLFHVSLRSSVLMSRKSSAARLARDGSGRLRSRRGCYPFSAAKGTPCSSGPPGSVPASALGGVSGAST